MIKLTANLGPALKAIMTVRGALKLLKVPFSDIGGHFITTTYDRFNREVAPDGTHWAPNADSTLLRYMQKRSGGKALSTKRTRTGGRTASSKGMRALAIKKILRDRGTLQDFMGYQAEDTVLRFSPSPATNAYAAAMQFGSPIGYIRSKPRLHIPARPYLGVTQEDGVYIQDTFKRFFIDKWSIEAP